ncbi:MAG: nitroreductase family protein [Treponema sp.]|jgi:nitroreductase|nr:nitroreductase family protein [Treponema sp.]
MNAIFERRSVRGFLPKAVEQDKIERILKAAFEAPSAKNRRPWEFLVVTAKEDLAAIGTMSPYARMCPGAAAAIVPCVNLGAGSVPPEQGPDGLSAPWWVQDLAAATENILIQITYEGLGGVWLGWYPDRDRMAALASRFALPPHIAPFSVVAFGYPAETPSPVCRYDSARVHYGAW